MGAEALGSRSRIELLFLKQKGFGMNASFSAIERFHGVHWLCKDYDPMTPYVDAEHASFRFIKSKNGTSHDYSIALKHSEIATALLQTPSSEIGKSLRVAARRLGIPKQKVRALLSEVLTGLLQEDLAEVS